MRGVGLGVLLACAIAPVACSRSDGSSSCVYGLSMGPSDGPSIDPAVCREWPGAYVEAQEDCAESAGPTDGGLTVWPMFSNGPCPRANIVGGCRSTIDGVSHTDWYYSPEAKSLTDVENACAYGGMTFVPPP